MSLFNKNICKIAIDDVESLQTILDNKLEQDEKNVSVDKIVTDEIKFNDKQTLKGQATGSAFDIILPESNGIDGDVLRLKSDLKLTYSTPLYMSKYKLWRNSVPILNNFYLLSDRDDGWATGIVMTGPGTVVGKIKMITDDRHNQAAYTGFMSFSIWKNSTNKGTLTKASTDWNSSAKPAATDAYTSTTYWHDFTFTNFTVAEDDVIYVAVGLSGTSMTTGSNWTATIQVEHKVLF